MKLFEMWSGRVGRVELTGEGLRCCDARDGEHLIKWESLQTIEGFKRDQITTDLICLAITYYNETEKIAEINEDMKGFFEAASELERQRFLEPNWWKLVNSQPFQVQKFVLFTSSGSY
ncbi:hypothetical protein [Methylosinus sp. LW4]|uniref:hypothetical protein n=1 Tax=Methylosinus sp. LW4 TaxID=136993 RepID=UPI0003A21A42|nr:hypothetical protein [Methylosinus sp. LW4]